MERILNDVYDRDYNVETMTVGCDTGVDSTMAQDEES